MCGCVVCAGTHSRYTAPAGQVPPLCLFVSVSSSRDVPGDVLQGNRVNRVVSFRWSPQWLATHVCRSRRLNESQRAVIRKHFQRLKVSAWDILRRNTVDSDMAAAVNDNTQPSRKQQARKAHRSKPLAPGNGVSVHVQGAASSFCTLYGPPS